MNLELSGGLGNQLFQYFAGKHLQGDDSLIYSTSYRHIESISEGILKFNLEEFTLKPGKQRPFLTNFIYRLFRRMLRESAKFNYWGMKYLGIYQSREVGFLENYPKNRKIEKVYGYFQSYLYVPQEINENGLQLKNPSEKIIGLVDDLMMVDPIAIHIRGGDYRNLTESVGILSSEYYKKAVELIMLQNPEPKVWLFSNDAELSEELIAKIGLKVDRKFTELELSASETLFLMSQANKIIISNSTFSWWAAYLRGRNKMVIAPVKWFRNMDDPKRLIPETWVKVESSWLL